MGWLRIFWSWNWLRRWACQPRFHGHNRRWLSSKSEPDEVFSKFTRAELVDSLSELLENNSQLKIKYKKLKKSLVSEIEQLKAENAELKENNIKLKDDFQKVQKISSSYTASSSKDILKEYDYSF